MLPKRDWARCLIKPRIQGKRTDIFRNTNVHWFDVRMDELKDLRIEANEVEKYVLRNHGSCSFAKAGTVLEGLLYGEVWKLTLFSRRHYIAFDQAKH